MNMNLREEVFFMKLVSKFIVFLPLILTGCFDDLPETADEFNSAPNRLELTEKQLTSSKEYLQYNDKFWCYHKEHKTDVWEKGHAICKRETATSPNCKPMADVAFFCGSEYKPDGHNKVYKIGE